MKLKDDLSMEDFDPLAFSAMFLLSHEFWVGPKSTSAGG
jgi:hypothetical protein